MQPGVQGQASAAKVLRDHHRRIRTLEALTPVDTDTVIWPTTVRLPLNTQGGGWNVVIDSSRYLNHYFDNDTDINGGYHWFVPIGPLIASHIWFEAMGDVGFGSLLLSIAGPIDPGTGVLPAVDSPRWIEWCSPNFARLSEEAPWSGIPGVQIPSMAGYELMPGLIAMGGAAAGQNYELGDELTEIDEGLGDGGPGYYYIRALPTGIVQLSEVLFQMDHN